MFCFFGSLFSTRISLFFWIRFRIYPFSSFVLIFGPSPRARFPSKLSYPLLLFIGKSPLKANKFFLILGPRSEGPRFRTDRPAVRTPPTKGNRGDLWGHFLATSRTFACTVILVHPPVANASFIGWPYYVLVPTYQLLKCVWTINLETADDTY